MSSHEPTLQKLYYGQYNYVTFCHWILYSERCIKRWLLRTLIYCNKFSTRNWVKLGYSLEQLVTKNSNRKRNRSNRILKHHSFILLDYSQQVSKYFTKISIRFHLSQAWRQLHLHNHRNISLICYFRLRFDQIFMKKILCTTWEYWH